MPMVSCKRYKKHTFWQNEGEEWKVYCLKCWIKNKKEEKEAELLRLADERGRERLARESAGIVDDYDEDHYPKYFAHKDKGETHNTGTV